MRAVPTPSAMWPIAPDVRRAPRRARARDRPGGCATDRRCRSAPDRPGPPARQCQRAPAHPLGEAAHLGQAARDQRGARVVAEPKPSQQPTAIAITFFSAPPDADTRRRRRSCRCAAGRRRSSACTAAAPRPDPSTRRPARPAARARSPSAKLGPERTPTRAPGRLAAITSAIVAPVPVPAPSTRRRPPRGATAGARRARDRRIVARHERGRNGDHQHVAIRRRPTPMSLDTATSRGRRNCGDGARRWRDRAPAHPPRRDRLPQRHVVTVSRWRSRRARFPTRPARGPRRAGAGRESPAPRIHRHYARRRGPDCGRRSWPRTARDRRPTGPAPARRRRRGTRRPRGRLSACRSAACCRLERDSAPGAQTAPPRLSRPPCRREQDDRELLAAVARDDVVGAPSVLRGSRDTPRSALSPAGWPWRSL